MWACFGIRREGGDFFFHVGGQGIRYTRYHVPGTVYHTRVIRYHTPWDEFQEAFFPSKAGGGGTHRIWKLWADLVEVFSNDSCLGGLRPSSVFVEKKTVRQFPHDARWGACSCAILRVLYGRVFSAGFLCFGLNEQVSWPLCPEVLTLFDFE